MFSDRGNVPIMAFLAGAALGAAAGLLLAPASGEESRARIRRTAARLRGEVGMKARSAGERIGRYTGDLKQAVEAGRAAYRSAREKETVPTG